MSANILTSEERQRLNRVPTEIGDEDLVRYFTLTAQDRILIEQRTGELRRLEQAAQICLLRWLGWSGAPAAHLPPTALTALYKQLDIAPTTDLQPPPKRTLQRYAQRACESLGWRNYTTRLEQTFQPWLQEQAQEHDHGNVLFAAVLDYLYQQKIVRPGLARLERLVEKTRTAVRRAFAEQIISQLDDEKRALLDDMVTIPAGEHHGLFQHLKRTPERASGNTLLAALDLIERARATGIEEIDLNALHPNRVKLLARRAKRRTNWQTARLAPSQRYAILVCFLSQALPTWIDQAVSMHTEIMKGIFRRAESRRDAEIVQQGRRLNANVLLLSNLVRLILDEEDITDQELRAVIYKRVPRERLAETVRECEEIAQPEDFAPYSFATRSYSYLRRFGPRFLDTLQFQAHEKENLLLEAIAFMRAVNAGEQQFENPPDKFIPWQWKAYVMREQNQVNRAMYELCLHDQLARAIERGELWVVGSHNYASFRRDWIPDEAWPGPPGLCVPISRVGRCGDILEGHKRDAGCRNGGCQSGLAGFAERSLDSKRAGAPGPPGRAQPPGRRHQAGKQNCAPFPPHRDCPAVDGSQSLDRCGPAADRVGRPHASD
jgi:hypothetical protein